MAVHDLGYRGWEGKLTPAWQRCLVIASAGIRRAWQSRWLRRLVSLAWLPATYYAFGFFVWERASLEPELGHALVPFLQGAPEELRAVMASDDPTVARHGVWSWLLLTFFRYPQLVLMVLVVGLISPPLISQDIRSRAFLLYFSRPLSQYEYLLGKFLTVWAYLAAISTLPALALYCVGVLLSPELSVLAATWDLPLRIVLASAVLAIPTATISLCLSAMTQESRYAAFAWFAIWILGWVTFAIMVSAEAFREQHHGQSLPTVVEAASQQWANVSPYHMLGKVQSWIFGFSSFHEVRWAVVVLVVTTLVALAVLNRRVTAPLRA